MTDVLEAKHVLRDRVWRKLIEADAVPHDSYGKIPGFEHSHLTAARLAETPEWRASEVIKANPDWAQLAVRIRALEEGKLLYMAVPRMASAQPFYLLESTDSDRSTGRSSRKAWRGAGGGTGRRRGHASH